MADGTPPDANGGAQPPQIPDQIVITVTFSTRDGSVNVNGPVADKVFCYGVLEMAKDAVRRYNPNRIVQPAAPALQLPPEFRR